MIADAASRTQIEIDVAVLAPAEQGSRASFSPLGEAKWDQVMDVRPVERLRRARDLLAVKGYDTRDTRLHCYSGAGFSPDLRAVPGSDVRLIGLDQIYGLGPSGRSVTL